MRLLSQKAEKYPLHITGRTFLETSIFLVVAYLLGYLEGTTRAFVRNVTLLLVTLLE